MTGRYKKGFMALGASFLLLFFVRFIYSFTDVTGESGPLYQSNVRDNDPGMPYNIASSKLSSREKGQKQPASADQKYERVATMENRSRKFEDDEKEGRGAIKKYGALIQFENRSGLPGGRYLFLAIGVDPEKFDEFVAEMKKIGTLHTLDIVKKDKTSEYKDLNSKKDSLLKARNSLIALKNRGGKIDEFINLENKILEIEKEIQKLGIKLGEYDAENEFCTVKFTLREYRGALGMPLLKRMVSALAWSVQIYFYAMVLFFLASLSLFFTLKVYDRVRIFLERQK